MLIEAGQRPAALEDIPALIPVSGGAAIATSDGKCREVAREEARKLFRSGDVIVAHTAFVSGRLRTPPASPLFDVMELFAFVHPAEPCVPSALGLARVLGLERPATSEASAMTLRRVVSALLDDLRRLAYQERAQLL